MYSAEQRLKTLLVAGLAGNASEYRLFLSELTRHLRGYLRKRIPHLHDDVEDLVQEILLAVHNHVIPTARTNLSPRGSTRSRVIS